uniref:Uncharacterized protein n=1 Tax=Catharus ustulatus TaxID=91951 RepID=A0A8C3V1K1_CATUS
TQFISYSALEFILGGTVSPEPCSAPAAAAVPCLSSPALQPGCCVSSSDSGTLLSITQGRCTPSNSQGLRRALLPPRTKTTKSQLRRECCDPTLVSCHGPTPARVTTPSQGTKPKPPSLA